MRGAWSMQGSRRRPWWAAALLAVAGVAMLLLVTGQRATAADFERFDTVAGPFFDAQSDAGDAVDLVASSAVHVEGDAATSADDEIRLTSVVRAPGGPLFDRSGDVILWYLNADGNPATGDTFTSGPIGAERQIAVLDPADGDPAGELRAWNGSAYEPLRPLGAGELAIDEPQDGLQVLTLEVPMADLSLPRGVTAGFAVRSEFALAFDLAPNGPPHYSLTVPPAPPPPSTPSEPFVGTTSATGIRQTTITLSGLVNPGGLPTTFRFEYGPTTSYGLETPAASAGSSDQVELVSRFLSDLTPGTTYHYRLVATNALGTAESADRTFETTDPRPPDVDDLAVADIGQTTATLSAGIDPNGAVTTYFFEYSLEGSTGIVHTPPGQTPATAAAAGTIVNASLTGLQPGATYRFALVASSAFGGPVRTPSETFTTLPLLPPAVDTTPASGVGQNAATLNGVIDPNGLPATHRFEYGLTTSYEIGSPPGGQVPAGDEPVPVSATVGNLRPQTVYHYRLVGESAAGAAVSADRTFITAAPPPPPPPTASTGQAQVTGLRTARLTGRIAASGAEGTAFFEWGPTRALGNRTSAVLVAGVDTLRAALTGLRPNRRYWYRLVIETPAGRVEGAILTLRTRPPPAIRTSVVAPLECSRRARECRLRRFAVGVRVVDPATGRPLSGAAATRGVLVRVSCARGCKLTRVFRLRPGRLMVRSLGGRRVAVRVTRRPGRLTVDLARLFTDRSGDRHAFSPRAEIQVRLTKAGYRPTGFKLRADISGELRNCAVRGTRLVGCRLES